MLPYTDLQGVCLLGARVGRVQGDKRGRLRMSPRSGGLTSQPAGPL